MIHRFQQRTQALQRFEPETGALYTLDTTAHLSGASRRRVLVYCRAGLIQPIIEPPLGILYFDDETIRLIRQIEALRENHGINLTGIRLIFELTAEVARLRQELQFLREA